MLEARAQERGSVGLVDFPGREELRDFLSCEVFAWHYFYLFFCGGLGLLGLGLFFLCVCL